MKLAHVSTWGKPAKHFDAFMLSAHRVGLRPQNADPEIWPGDDWQTIEWFRKTRAQYKFVQAHRHEYTHFMFTDAYDIICAGGPKEIEGKFGDINAPIVFGAESYPWPNEGQAQLYPFTGDRCRFLNAGFWIGETEPALAFLEDISKIAEKREQCDQGICVDAFLQKRHQMALDTKCRFLFCMNNGSAEFLECKDGRPFAKDTGEYPAFFHGNGNADLTPVLKCLGL